MPTTPSLTDTDSETLTVEAHELIGRAATATGLTDEETERLWAISTELDRRGVTYDGPW